MLSYPELGRSKSFCLLTDVLMSSLRFAGCDTLFGRLNWMTCSRGALFPSFGEAVKYDYGGPNSPVSLRWPPPTTKGTSEATMLQMFPNISMTVHHIATVAFQQAVH
ncbi:arachidonate 12-lipoxygenase%2C 12R-type-like isoform X2 [Scomber scombrus]|uniref:Arachidonate 12-lipoxygenase, 12R-type-like isoform X2 n=1 Tax=Scomber scombrus TaxID=13677 RepID=A0AAV1Q7J0_SCOSC